MSNYYAVCVTSYRCSQSTSYYASYLHGSLPGVPHPLMVIPSPQRYDFNSGILISPK